MSLNIFINVIVLRKKYYTLYDCQKVSKPYKSYFINFKLQNITTKIYRQKIVILHLNFKIRTMYIKYYLKRHNILKYYLVWKIKIKILIIIKNIQWKC